MSKRAANSDKEKKVDGLLDEYALKLAESRKELDRAEIAVERIALKKYQPLYEKRRAVLKSIPLFWTTSILNHPQLAMIAQLDEDQEALKFLEDVWVIRDPKEHRAFTLELHFAENPYFSDKLLSKEYKYIGKPAAEDTPDADGITNADLDFEPSRDLAPQPVTINWKEDGKNLAKLHPMEWPEGEEYPEEGGSFFNFILKDKDPYEIGLVLANELFPDADRFFFGPDEDEELDDDSEDEEDDDDEDEIDLEKPKKKVRKA